MPRQMSQADLFGGPALEEVINVAKVAKLSPFRYPGGKTWLVPHVRKWLHSMNTLPVEFVEPFAGGGIVSLTVAAESLAAHVTMVELDEQVAAVWQAIFGNSAEWLARTILDFDLNHKNLEASLSKQENSVRARAFQTILKNRTFHGGILAPGSAPLKHGENGKGIKSRWYPETISRRIREAACLRDKITFIHGDAFEVLERESSNQDCVFFLDPPYTAGGKKAGNRLYNCYELDHERLFEVTARLRGSFLMTYDAAEEIRNLARKHALDCEEVAMKNTHHAEMRELLIGKDLDWARRKH
jgi:DNA adenine methylase